jgi:hypothetical protein
VATVATISDTAWTAGLTSTLSPGTTTIEISSGTVSATATLVVDSAALVSIAINPQNATIALGMTEQFTATGSYTDSSTQDLTSAVTWATSNATVAIISNSVGSYGLATSSGSGTATISATSNTISASTTLNVSSVTAAPILSRVPERICLVEIETATSSSCTLSSGIPVGDGVVVLITSTTGQTLATNALQDTNGNTYTLLAGPVSGGYGALYMGYSVLTTGLSIGDSIMLNVPGADSWGLSIYDIGPAQNNQADVGVTFQNANVGFPNFNNPATGVPGWWTGQTSLTTGTSDMCMAALGVGPGGTGNGPPSPITTFTADNNFTGLAMTQFYAQSDPSYSSGGSVLSMYAEVPAGTAVQSHVTTSDSVPNTAPSVLYCFQEGSGSVTNTPWFSGNFCTGQVSCTINNVAAGDMLVITAHTFNALPGNPITITDSLGESVAFDQISGSVGLGTWHISPVVNAGTHTITVSDPLDGGILMDIAEISGQGSGNPVEAVAQNSFNTSSLASVNLMTITPNDLVFGWGRSYFGSDEAEGFTAIRVAPTAEYEIAPAAGLDTVSILPRGTSPWTATGIQAMAIRPVGSSQPPIAAPGFTGNYCIGMGNSCTISNVVAGDMLVISSLWTGTLQNTPGISDSQAETIVVDRGNDTDNTLTLSTWHIAAVINAGSHTISVNYAERVVVSEYTGQSSNPVDAVTGATATSGGVATSTVQTSQGNDLIYAWCSTDVATGSGDSFAALSLSPTAEFRMASSTPGAETATCLSSPNDPSAGWVIQELAIRH